MDWHKLESRLCPPAEDGKSKTQMTHECALRISIWFRLRDRQRARQADQSITKNTVSALLCGTLQVGERSVNSLLTGGASGETAQLLQEATPQYSTIHQWLLQSY